jgi:hypothetical protein
MGPLLPQRTSRMGPQRRGGKRRKKTSGSARTSIVPPPRSTLKSRASSGAARRVLFWRIASGGRIACRNADKDARAHLNGKFALGLLALEEADFQDRIESLRSLAQPAMR